MHAPLEKYKVKENFDVSIVKVVANFPTRAFAQTSKFSL
jgi:hypothetical protein